MNRHKGLLIAGSAMIAEGAAFAFLGRRYLNFMERHGLMDLGKWLLRKKRVRSAAAFAAVGAAEAVAGVLLVKRATS